MISRQLLGHTDYYIYKGDTSVILVMTYIRYTVAELISKQYLLYGLPCCDIGIISCKYLDQILTSSVSKFLTSMNYIDIRRGQYHYTYKSTLLYIQVNFIIIEVKVINTEVNILVHIGQHHYTIIQMSKSLYRGHFHYTEVNILVHIGQCYHI